MQSFDFSDLKPCEQVVTIPTGFGGNGRKNGYVLKDASEAAFRDFRTAQSKGTTVSGEKTSQTMSIGAGIGDSDSVLLKGCLFEVKEDGTHGAVSLGFILALPRKITQALVKQSLQWIIDAEEHDAPKEQPNSTSETST